MNLTQLRDLVIDITGRTDKTSIVNRGLVMAFNDLARRHNFRVFFTEHTTTPAADTTHIALPTNFRKFYETRVDGHSVVLKARKWISEKYPRRATDSAGQPLYCFLAVGELHFAPRIAADKPVVMTYVTCPDLTGAMAWNADGAFDDVVVNFTTAFVFRSINMPDVASYWQREYLEALRQVVLDDCRTNEYLKHDGFTDGYEPDGIEPYLDPFKRS